MSFCCASAWHHHQWHDYSGIANAEIAVAEPGRRKSAAAPGTRDEDWLFGLDEAKLNDDDAAVAEAEHRKCSGVQRPWDHRPSASSPAAAGGGGGSGGNDDTTTARMTSRTTTRTPTTTVATSNPHPRTAPPEARQCSPSLRWRRWRP
jgi:hypothetical protein